MIGCSYGVFTVCAVFLIAFIAIYFGNFQINKLRLTVFVKPSKLTRMRLI